MKKILFEMTRRNRDRKNATEVVMSVIEGNDWHYYEIIAKNPQDGSLYAVAPYSLVVFYKDDSYRGTNKPLYDGARDLIKTHKVTELEIFSFPGTAEVAMSAIKIDLPPDFSQYLKDKWALMDELANEAKAECRKTNSKSILLMTLIVNNSLAIPDGLLEQMEPEYTNV